ncbi:MAG: invasion associated locus B family protein [Pseudomonadota bacterium]
MKQFAAVIFSAWLVAVPTDGMSQTVEAAPDAPQGREDIPLGAEYDIESYGDWTVRCLRVEGNQDPCSLYQLMRNVESSPIAEVSLFPLFSDDSEAIAAAVFTVPLETFLRVGLTLSVDGDEIRRYPYEFCNEAGCVARVGLTQADVDAFRRGSKGVLTLVPASSRETEVKVVMSLSGFTAGFDALSE